LSSGRGELPESVDPFAETASKRQIAACQSDYHNRRFNRVLDESGYEFLDKETGQSAECDYKRAITLLRPEKGKQRVRRALEEKEEQDRWGDKESTDLDRTPPAGPAAELEAAKKLAAIKSRKPSASFRTSQEQAVVDGLKRLSSRLRPPWSAPQSGYHQDDTSCRYRRPTKALS
jgi:splicing factor 3B subunit 1